MDDALQGIGTVSLQVRMRPEQRQALHVLAKGRGTTITALVLGLLEEPVVELPETPSSPPLVVPDRPVLRRPASAETMSQRLARRDRELDERDRQRRTEESNG